MWLVDPRYMCQQHLLGEHVEMHMFHTTLSKKMLVTGYISNNLLEPESLLARHQALEAEMIRRGMNHMSPMDVQPSLSYLIDSDRTHKIDREAALAELHNRCPECRERFNKRHVEYGRVSGSSDITMEDLSA